MITLSFRRPEPTYDASPASGGPRPQRVDGPVEEGLLAERVHLPEHRLAATRADRRDRELTVDGQDADVEADPVATHGAVPLVHAHDHPGVADPEVGAVLDVRGDAAAEDPLVEVAHQGGDVAGEHRCVVRHVGNLAARTLPGTRSAP